MNTKITKENSKEKKGNEISFIKKCIILANIFQNKNKFVVNLFNNIPYVKLYTANLIMDNFIYSKIKGALFLIYEKNKDQTNFFFQIYDLNDYSLVFSLPIYPKMLEGVIIEEKFIIIPTKYYFIGFKFKSIEAMKNLILMLKCEEQNKEIITKAKEFDCQSTDIINVIKNVKDNFDKELKNIDKEINKIGKTKNSFQKLDDLYCLINCIEYSEINKKINIFIDKTLNPYIIKPYIDSYKNSKNQNLLPYKIVFNDYNQIKNKKAYIDILVKNLLNNFEEEKRLIVFKKEHKKRHQKEQYAKNNIDIRSSAMALRPKFNIDDKNKYKTSIQSNMNVIKEEEEENNIKNKNSKK